MFNDLLRRVITHTVSRRHPQIISFIFLIETDLIHSTALFSVFHFLLSPSAEVPASAHSAGSCLAAHSQSLTPFPSDHSEMQLSVHQYLPCPGRNPEWWLPAYTRVPGTAASTKHLPGTLLPWLHTDSFRPGINKIQDQANQP